MMFRLATGFKRLMLNMGFTSLVVLASWAALLAELTIPAIRPAWARM